MKKEAQGREQRLSEFVARISARGHALPEEHKRLLDTFLNETFVGLALIRDQLDGADRVLEVGCGVGALAGFLAEEGYDVTGVEPSALGFPAMEQLGAFVTQNLRPGVSLRIVRAGAADLSGMNMAPFDLIFSVHVLEHVSNLKEAMASLTQVLAPNGAMVHLCPNYRLPYEPHFGVPILGNSTAFTRRAFARRIETDVDLWNSLNFVTEDQLRQMARDNGLSFRLRAGVMTSFLRRLNEDALFRARHRGFVAVVGRFIARTPLLKILDMIPPSWTTPMAAELRRSERT